MADISKITFNNTTYDLKDANAIKEPANDGTSGQVLTTDGNGGRSWTTVQGGGGITDVQVNGESVVTGSVASIPVAGSTNYGVVKYSNVYGLSKTGSGILCTYKATASDIKTGTDSYRPITPELQGNAVFYGLATAAGDSTQSASSSSVGSYTDGAKTAIRTMIGSASADEIIISDTQPSVAANKLWVDSDNTAEYTVPTYAEHQALQSKVDVIGDYQSATFDTTSVANATTTYVASITIPVNSIWVISGGFDFTEGFSQAVTTWFAYSSDNYTMSGTVTRSTGANGGGYNVTTIYSTVGLANNIPVKFAIHQSSGSTKTIRNHRFCAVRIK